MRLFIFYLISLGVLTMAVDRKLAEIESRTSNFRYAMLNEIVKDAPTESAVLSPYSVLNPLAQLTLGSRGGTLNELLYAMGMPDSQVVQTVLPRAENAISKVKGIELKKASKIYIGRQYDLNDNVAVLTRDLFNSEIEKVDFENSRMTAKKINNWICNQTNHKIKDMVDSNSLGKDTRILLANAIYFKGLWKLPFDVHKTKKKEFHVTNKSSIVVDMMYQKEYFNYTESRELKAQILQMFFEGGQACMIIVLPNEIGISDIVNKMRNPVVLNHALAHKYEIDVDVSLPKFELSTTIDLKEVLSNLGINKIFTPGEADLTNLLDGDNDVLYIGAAIHKAYIKVDEKGSEASAANVFHDLKSSSMYNRKIFNANRPFYFEIRVRGLPIFCGIKAFDDL